VGLIARDPEHVQIFGFTALFPVTFVSNVFVPVETMPGWLQGVVNANPVSILADAARGLLVGGPTRNAVIGSIMWAIAIMLVFVPLSLWRFKRRV
jgi:oleandomycin transport system permease protein